MREMRKADPATLYEVRIDGPVMPSIDPVKDRQSSQIDQEMGWESRHGIIRRFGRSPTQVDAERATDPFKPASMMPAAESEPPEREDDEDEDE